MQNNLRRTLARLKIFFIDFPIEGIKEFYVALKSFSRKPDNYILIMLFYCLVLTFIFIKYRNISVHIIVVAAIMLVLITYWRFLITGEIDEKLKKDVEKKVSDIEEKKEQI